MKTVIDHQIERARSIADYLVDELATSASRMEHVTALTLLDALASHGLAIVPSDDARLTYQTIVRDGRWSDQ